MSDPIAVPEASPVAAEAPLAVTELPAAQQSAPASKYDAVVDLWFAECVQGTSVGRYTDAYNAIYAAKEELKRRLSKETL
jgi:hypothetical protein